ncbi:hypothetical protein ON010_g4945 [Phytophthora cinnamomi]|nr:hypothetical protein ON010_g4945 [Phytophthora cinnamomi]
MACTQWDDEKIGDYLLTRGDAQLATGSYEEHVQETKTRPQPGGAGLNSCECSSCCRRNGTPTTKVASDTWVQAELRNTPTKRILRAHIPTTDREERGISAAIADTLKISNSLKSPATNDEQLNAWFVNGKTTHEVFKLLTLDKATDSVLGSPHIPSTAGIAKRVQAEQIQRWLESKRNPHSIFRLLDLDIAKTELFTKPQVKAWMEYMDFYNKKYPNSKATMFLTLEKRYDEQTLVNMLIAVHKVPTTKTIAMRVQAEQTQFWLLDETSPNTIFALLAPNNKRHATLFASWIKYTDDFNLLYLRYEDPAVSTLLKHFSLESLAKMVAEANEIPSSQSMAKTVEL